MSKKLPMILNTYKLTSNNFVNKIGFDVFHTAIEFDGTEYAFGYINQPDSGVYEITPMTFEDGIFCESIKLGYCETKIFLEILEKIKREYIGNTYSIVLKNCNHFTNDFCKKIFNREIPKRFRFGLKIGEFFRRIM